MLTGLDHAELLAENLPTADLQPAPAVVQELTHLALTVDELPILTAELFETLRKISGQTVAPDFLGAIQMLAAHGSPAGARLLAAFLNVATPGDRLLPKVRPLDSCRRYQADLARSGGGQGPMQADWLDRLVRCNIAAQKVAQSLELKIAEPVGRGPRLQQPWPLMRAVFAFLLSQVANEKFWQADAAPGLLTEFLRLEVDAWQERISRLAGSINPFRVESVARVLPLLNRADSEIRDLRMMATWVAERDLEAAFVKPLPRWRETLDEKDWGHLLRDLQRSDELAGLARLAQGLVTRPILLPQLAQGTRQIMTLSTALADIGVRDGPLDMLTACLLAQSHFANGQIVFTLDGELSESLETVLPDPADTEHPLHGVSLMSGLLIIELNDDLRVSENGLPHARAMSSEEEADLRRWRYEHQLLDPAECAGMQEQDPTLAIVEEEEEEEDLEDMGAAALKHLVMMNIQSVSVLLGFLRNPKIIGIPGLVEDVVNRTRNPQIIATVASDRALHTGFANKGVALACLRSPVNVSVKTLRKFCHVKFVSKVDLKRMASDRTGIRKEVAREIAKYLETLA